MIGISVIIPVYNAAPFVTKAVNSALQQEQVTEIILVEDNSTDSSLEICKSLALVYEEVSLYTHPNRVNKGAAASRNLGLEKASYPLIAFLDADDYYIEGRFDKAMELFNKHPDADGVYGKAKYHFYSDKAKVDYQIIYGHRDSVGLNRSVSPNELFEIFMVQKGEWFILDCVVLKKPFLDKLGLFDTALRQAQDTDFLLRCCLYGRLYSTEEGEPKVVIGIHDNNRVLDQQEAKFYRFLLLKKWLKKSLSDSFSKRVNRYLIRAFLDVHPLGIKYRRFTLVRIICKIYIVFRLTFLYPRVVLRFSLNVL